MGGIKNFTTIFVLFMIVISGCSLFVAQAPVDDEKVCVSKEKLNAAKECSDELLKEMSKLQGNTGGSRKSRRNQRGGSSDAVQFGCRQPEWTPDCR